MEHTPGPTQTSGSIDTLEPEPPPAATVGPPPAPPAREREDPTANETVLVRQIRYFVAIASFAAGLLHVLAMIDHRGEPTLARSFLAVAAIQIVWGVLLIVDPRKIFVLVGALATAGSILVWVYSRTKGISWFPGLDHVEELGWRDVVTQFFQLLALAGAGILLLPASVHQPAGKKIEVIPIAIMAVLTMLTIAVLYAGTHAGGHVH
jgi:hypothetical protein